MPSEKSEVTVAGQRRPSSVSDADRRVYATCIGSLPRPEPLLARLAARERGERVDATRFAETEREAVFEAVHRQVSWGIDIPSNGELGRPGFFHYIKDRFTGFGGSNSGWTARDLADHPDLGRQLYHQARVAMNHSACTEPIKVADPEAVHRDIELFGQALTAAGHTGPAVLTVPGPGVVVMNIRNDHYPSDRHFMAATVEALAHEYRAVVAAGYLLQVDCPDLFLARNVALPDSPHDDPRYRTRAQYDAHVELSVTALVDVLADLPADRLRVHACNGNHPGTHEFDVSAGEIIDRLLALPVGALCLENANPQHRLDHEPILAALADRGWPPGRTVVPGIVDTKSPVLEPPELLARRADEWLRAVPWRPVGLSTDCGLSTYAGYPHLAESVAWSKVRRLGEVARRINQAAGARD